MPFERGHEKFVIGNGGTCRGRGGGCWAMYCVLFASGGRIKLILLRGRSPSIAEICCGMDPSSILPPHGTKSLTGRIVALPRSGGFAPGAVFRAMVRGAWLLRRRRRVQAARFVARGPEGVSAAYGRPSSTAARDSAGNNARDGVSLFCEGCHGPCGRRFPCGAAGGLPPPETSAGRRHRGRARASAILQCANARATPGAPRGRAAVERLRDAGPGKWDHFRNSGPQEVVVVRRLFERVRLGEDEATAAVAVGGGARALARGGLNSGAPRRGLVEEIGGKEVTRKVIAEGYEDSC